MEQKQQHILGQLMSQPENKVCADCGATGIKLFYTLCVLSIETIIHRSSLGFCQLGRVSLYDLLFTS